MALLRFDCNQSSALFFSVIRRCSETKSHNAFCLVVLPRCSRDITVSMGIFNFSATSKQLKPSASINSMGNRNVSGRFSIASRVSAARKKPSTRFSALSDNQTSEGKRLDTNKTSADPRSDSCELHWSARNAWMNECVGQYSEQPCIGVGACFKRAKTTKSI